MDILEMSLKVTKLLHLQEANELKLKKTPNKTNKTEQKTNKTKQKQDKTKQYQRNTNLYLTFNRVMKHIVSTLEKAIAEYQEFSVLGNLDLLFQLNDKWKVTGVTLNMCNRKHKWFYVSLISKLILF